MLDFKIISTSELVNLLKNSKTSYDNIKSIIIELENRDLSFLSENDKQFVIDFITYGFAI